MSKLQSKLKNLPPQLVLKPCDIEFSKSFKNIEEGIWVKMSVSEIEVHVAATTVHTVVGEYQLEDRRFYKKFKIWVKLVLRVS